MSTIHIAEEVLQTKLEELAAAFNSILKEKDGEIAALKDQLSNVEPALDSKSEEEVSALNARLEKAKEFFKAQKAEIEALKAENDELKGRIVDLEMVAQSDLPF